MLLGPAQPQPCAAHLAVGAGLTGCGEECGVPNLPLSRPPVRWSQRRKGTPHPLSLMTPAPTPHDKRGEKPRGLLPHWSPRHVPFFIRTKTPSLGWWGRWDQDNRAQMVS